MDLLHKHKFLTFLTVVTMILALIGLVFLYSGSRKGPIMIRSTIDENVELLPYEKDGDYSFFIPSGLDYKDLYIQSKEKIFCNSRSVESSALSGFADLEEASYQIGERKCMFYFYHSENIPAMFVETLKKDMDYVNEDKSHQTDISVMFMYDDGSYSEIYYNAQIRGRGNNSWNADKKSYRIDFSDPQDLLNMGVAEDWILIPSTNDVTRIANKVVSEFALDIGLAWAPEMKFVDVYLDGEYNGLYLLSEKIQIDDERLNLDKGEYLLKRELSSREEQIDNSFVTDMGDLIEICDPNEVSVYHKEQIRKQVQEMEDALRDMSSNNYRTLVYMDSWARAYLIDELFDNLDAGIASAYFYYNDGRFCRGPLWDYDAIMMDSPRAMIANSEYRQPYSKNDYYYLLNQKQDFKNRIKEMLSEVFDPVIDIYVNEKIDAISNEIAKARECDVARWGNNFTLSNITNFKDYLLQKSAFMKQYWKHEDRYCKIQIQYESFYLTYMVEKGKTIDEAYDFDMSFLENKQFHYADSDEIFDPETPIEEDIRLDLPEKAEEVVAEEQDLSIIERIGLLNAVFLSLFVFLLLCVIIKGIINNYV